MSQIVKQTRDHRMILGIKDGDFIVLEINVSALVRELNWEWYVWVWIIFWILEIFVSKIFYLWPSIAIAFGGGFLLKNINQKMENSDVRQSKFSSICLLVISSILFGALIASLIFGLSLVQTVAYSMVGI
jgi:hypothetical protein